MNTLVQQAERTAGHAFNMAVPDAPAAVDVHLSQTPFIYREAAGGNSLRRDLIIPLGASGYATLHDIAQLGRVVVVAVRHLISSKKTTTSLA